MPEDWRYCGLKTWPELDGPDTEALTNLRCYDTKAYKLSLSAVMRTISLNADGTLLAIADGNDIHIYETSGFRLELVLKSHLSPVKYVAFHPKLYSKLVSTSEVQRTSSNEEDPTIVWWQLNRGKPNVAESVSEVVTKKKMFGRLQTSFQSQLFNRDGSYFIYMPGDEPESNSVSEWNICIWDVLKEQDLYILHGHTDAIMWTGFSPDDKRIGSVSWDQSFRIWDVEDGCCLHVFKTKQQNWTGGFSPDSRYFAGTSGDGILWVYNVDTGIHSASYDFSLGDPRGFWGRALDWRPKVIAGIYTLALGSQRGRLSVFEFDRQALTLRRSWELLGDGSLGHPRSFIGGPPETATVRFLSDTKLIWGSPANPGVQVYDIENNVTWRFERMRRNEFGPKRRAPFLLGSKNIIACFDEGELKLWKFPSQKGDGRWTYLDGAGWSKEVGVWRQPAAQAAREILVEF